jgi:hypothetical protein
VEEKKLRFTLMSGPEALQNENIIRLFEAIKGRAATPAEIDEMQAQRERRLFRTVGTAAPPRGRLELGLGSFSAGLRARGRTSPIDPSARRIGHAG